MIEEPVASEKIIALAPSSNKADHSGFPGDQQDSSSGSKPYDFDSDRIVPSRVFGPFINCHRRRYAGRLQCMAGVSVSKQQPSLTAPQRVPGQ